MLCSAEGLVSHRKIDRVPQRNKPLDTLYMCRLDGDSHAEIRGDCLAHRLALPSNGTCFAAGGYKLYPPTIAYGPLRHICHHDGAAGAKHAPYTMNYGNFRPINLGGGRPPHLTHTLLQGVHAIHTRVHV